MNKATCVVTGGNTGIGKAIASELAMKNYHVVIVSRDPQKGKAAIEEIKNSSGSSSIDLITGDLGSIQSTKKLALAIIELFPDVSILINNAGIWPARLETNTDGLEMAFMVNHMAPFILSYMLLDRLKKNALARIVNVNAGLYVRGKLDMEKTPYGNDFGRLSTYMNTKLCNIYFTQKYAETIDGTGVTINAVHPGVIRTNLGITSGFIGSIIKLMKRNFDTPEAGAKAPVWLAISPDVDKINGRYFDLCVEKPFTRNATNIELRNKLWDLSKKLASL